ncbi:MAG: hypothetical protein JO041_12215 [Acidobacteria bacterium]|nr:hypothetical protein [Acidobacteriota bacterium]
MKITLARILLMSAWLPAFGVAQNVKWTAFQDPFEKAFTLEVPQGWTVKGGLFRLGYSDERIMVDLKSPDGRINYRIGDVAIPSYTLPNPYHPREGEVYDLGAQAQMVVANYRTGPEFAALYSQTRFREVCRNPVGDQANNGFSPPDYVPATVRPEQVSAGQIAYRCESAQGPETVVAWAKTGRTGQIWGAETVSYVVPPDRAAALQAIIVHSVGSLRFNPQWLEYQKRMDDEGLNYQRIRQQQRREQLNQQMQQFEAKMRSWQNQVNAFERHQQAQAAQVEDFTNALNGITPTYDPLTGQARQVWSGTRNGFWVNGQGTVLNSDVTPGSGWRQLQVIHPQ